MPESLKPSKPSEQMRYPELMRFDATEGRYICKPAIFGSLTGSDSDAQDRLPIIIGGVRANVPISTRRYPKGIGLLCRIELFWEKLYLAMSVEAAREPKPTGCLVFTAGHDGTHLIPLVHVFGRLGAGNTYSAARNAVELAGVPAGIIRECSEDMLFSSYRAALSRSVAADGTLGPWTITHHETW